MSKIQQLERHGLFDAKVPRYTSYPPANHFLPTAGAEHQDEWLTAVPDGAEVSLYIHIPFCRRLCWFCACRTQGTQSLRPVDAYIELLLRELETVREKLPNRVRMSRLHLGGGTPTLLSATTMTLLLSEVFAVFEKTEGFEFSVEVDPTEAADDLLAVLAEFGMARASMGVQDFDPRVQNAVGRMQSFEQTHRTAETLRRSGVKSLNLDLLYGLPFQTEASLHATIQQALALQPDRIALYGYAHVPWMAKRQVMIDDNTLPLPIQRFELSELAHETFVLDGFEPVGIDHFARSDDSLARAARTGTLRRNFQGYTDDPSLTLIGLGASAISQFPQGFTQNAAVTSAYQDRVRAVGLAGARGFVLSEADRATARMVEMLMCDFALDPHAVSAEFPRQSALIEGAARQLIARFPDACAATRGTLTIKPESRALTRIIAHTLDTYRKAETAHSAAI